MKVITQISLISIFSLTIIFHLLVLVKIIPYKIVWGGRLKSDVDMYKFETVSLILNFFFLFIVLLKSNMLAVKFHDSILNFILWMMVILFSINTVGNLFSKTYFEKIVFTGLTLLIAILIIILLLCDS